MPVLRGTEFDLSIGESLVNSPGNRPAVTINGNLPGPAAALERGTTVTLRVRNDLPQGSSHGPDTLHPLHGICCRQHDGVPGMSSDGIRPAKRQYRSTSNRAAPTGTTATPVSRNRAGCTGTGDRSRGAGPIARDRDSW